MPRLTGCPQWRARCRLPTCRSAPSSTSSGLRLEELSVAIELNDLPPALAEQVPVLRGYKFVKLPDKVLFVAPSNRIVVGEVMK